MKAFRNEKCFHGRMRLQLEWTSDDVCRSSQGWHLCGIEKCCRRYSYSVCILRHHVRKLRSRKPWALQRLQVAFLASTSRNFTEIQWEEIRWNLYGSAITIMHSPRHSRKKSFSLPSQISMIGHFLSLICLGSKPNPVVSAVNWC